MSRHFQSTDFSEPYSSVSFQYKQQTSPYPYSQHENIFPKKQQIARWYRLHQKTILLLSMFLLFVLYCLRGTVSVYWTFVKIKMDNTMFDRGYVACGLLRKEPMLFIQDTQHVQVIWEMNCGMSNKEMAITYWHQDNEAEKTVIGSLEPKTLDAYHTVYKATLGPLVQGGSIHYTIDMIKQNKLKKRLAGYTFEWFIDRDQQPIRIAAIADNQFGMMTFSSILRQIRKLPQKPHFLLHAGDAVQNYPSLRQWQTDFAAPLTAHGLVQTMPLIYAHGNHDYDTVGDYTYSRSANSDTPWFAFSMANNAIRFIVLDSNLDWDSQDEWLRQEIKTDEFKRAQFRIVVVHVPPFLEYWDPEAWFQLGQSEWGAFIKDRYVPLFEEGGVDLVISGHQHNYERGERHGVHYAIIGGAGGDLDFEQVKDWGMYEAKLLDFHFVMLEFRPSEVPNEPWVLQWDTYDIKGQKVDTALIAARPKTVDF
ncbi:Metallo-dependent phosphatase-like protein [Gilbertella persicaria]|uniref:Metallo-dependent phosphatase-like protein n=1 Tax=Gilbertella persicaria TaxID=101096 RepID=UPI00221F419B|nr:Metallo-dependent phosphatase-like protein [Gilbertella persicaria]KAI8083357.1 Metallo-dependent phosphatase-like protein [Gilbertella persicaria]